MEEFRVDFGKGIADSLAISAYVGARDKGRPNPCTEGLIALNGEASFLYALHVLHGPFELGELAISRSAEWSVKYARFILKGRFRMGERGISLRTDLCYSYFKYVIKKKLPRKMHLSMMKKSDDHFASKYLSEVLQR